MALRTTAALAGFLALAGPVLPQNQDPSASAGGGAETSFEDISARATRAREAERLEQAASLYREAVDLRPDWAEGWWFLGSMAYERDRHEGCRDAFARLLELDPQIGPAWALRGLCEFSLGAYDSAEQHLAKAMEVGPVTDEPLWWVVLYHQALLDLRAGEFERALRPLRQLASRPGSPPEVQEACGLRLLRRAQLPADIPEESRDFVRAVGQAECASLAGRRAEAEKHFQALLARYPRERHLHYGLGLLLAQGGQAEAVEAFRREVELHPDHVLAHVELAFNLLKLGRAEEAVPAAEAAVRLDPEVFVTHLALGRALVAVGDLTLGLFELESAARLAPTSPDVYFALAQAYAAAGRQDDANRANARFRELDRARRSAEASP
ncbi:MAG: tetratricopeptide repeat protein [Acidobacteria bacterium]|nr:tetratricopeptide repeat protein [Acidobacteriota bacterium]